MQDQQNQIRDQGNGHQPRNGERERLRRFVKTFRSLGPHHRADLSVVRSGATPSRALGRAGRHPIPRCAAQLISQSEATPPTPVRLHIGPQAPFCGGDCFGLDCTEIFKRRDF
jgi:hypothetical protein